MRATVIAVLLAACVTPPNTSPDAGPDSGVPMGDGGCRQLGMNDVSVLVPLDVALVPPDALVPKALYDRVVLDEQGQPFVIDNYAELQVVSVRFDLCDRTAAGRCPQGDARLRLVLQPNEQGQVRDTALHAFYAVPQADVPAVLDALEQLAALQGLQWDAPLQVSPALRAQPDGGYATGLAAVLTRWCSPASLRRLTFFTQPDFFAQVRWVLRGIERSQAGDAFSDIVIPGLADAGMQHVFFEEDGYQSMSLADVPGGFSTVISGSAFSAADPTARATAMDALAEIEDPLRRGVDTLQCVACHVSTPLSGLRDAGLSMNRYASAYSASIDGGASADTSLSLRGFGWRLDQPMISRRVVNETAQVLVELGACR